MKKFYSLSLLFVVSAFCYMANGFTGKEDNSASKLTNADFMTDAPVTQTIRTYAKDMADNGAGSDGAGLYGMQPVTGWTANNPTDNIKHTTDGDTRDAQAAGVFAIYDEGEFDELDEETLFGLGGAYYAKGDKTKQALGIVGVWGASPVYSQDVTLPAGTYILVVSLYNAAGTGTVTNKIGFVSESKSFLSDSTTYQVGVWENDTIVIELDAETSGQVTLGLSHGSGSGSAPHIFIENVKIFTVDAAEVEAAKIAAAKAELLDLINLGKAYNVETAASEAVYNDPNATLAQVQAAIASQTEINDAGVTDLSAYFITNSHFDLDEPLEGGICTYDYDCASNGIPLTNYSMLPVSGWDRMKTDNGCASGVYAIGSGAFLGGKDYVVPTTMSDGSSEGKVLGFVTCWTMSVQYKQTVTLPAGDYTLTMSYYNTGGTNAIAKNLIGFVADDGTEHLSTRTTFPVGTWTSDEIKFTLNEETTGYFSLGYTSTNTGSGNMPHFFTDGISLVYVGSGIDPSMFALKAAVSGANKVKDNDFYTELKAELVDAINAGQALIDDESADRAANQAAYEKLTALTSAANTNIAAYKSLDEFYNEGGAYDVAVNKYDADTYPTLRAELDELGDGIFGALNDYNWDTEKINSAIASLDSIIVKGVQAAWDNAVASGEVLENDIDISVLFDHIGKNGDFEGWTTTKGSISLQYNVAEIYNNTPFTVSKVITNLPKGKYTVTTKGFYRIGSNEVNYDAFQGGSVTGAYVYAGASKTNMTNQAAATFSTAEEFKGLTETVTGSGVYVINNREGAAQIFNDATYGELFQKSASATLTTTGDSLTFGIMADELKDANWVTWYEFSISYNAADDEALNTELTDQIAALEAAKASLETYLDDKQENITSPESDAAQDVVDEAGDVVDYANEQVDADTEAVTAAIDSVKATIVKVEAALASAQKNVAAVEACKAARTTLEETVNDESLTPSDEALEEAATLDDEDATDDAIAALTTAEVEALTLRINDAIAALKIPAAAKDASDDNPVDMTGLIANANIDEGATVGWSYTKNGGNGPALANGIGGTPSIEFWRDPATSLQFNIWQDIANLPAGKYELKAQASNSMNGVDAKPTDGTGRAFLYAATYVEGNDTTYFSSDPVAVQEEACTEKYDTYSVIFSLNEGERVIVGIQSVGTMAARWFVADNFTLTYYGSESAKADSENPMSVDGIEAASAEIAAIYTAAGAQVSALQPGLNIVKYADGTVKKIFVK